MRLWTLVFCAGVGCIPAFDVDLPGAVITHGPDIKDRDYAQVSLVYVLEVSTDVPTLLTVDITGAGTSRRIRFPTQTTEHVVPLLGLVELETYEASVILTTPDLVEVHAGPVPVEVGLATDKKPDRTLYVSDPDHMEPGYTIYPTKGVNGTFSLVQAVDAQGRLVWQYNTPKEATPDASVTALQFHPSDGTLSGLVNSRSVRRFDLAMLTEERAWANEVDLMDGEMSVDVPKSFHHEAAFAPDGTFWTLYTQDVEVEGYPVDASDPSVLGDAIVVADVVVHVGTDGAVLGEWALSEYLDIHRVGFDASPSPGEQKPEWSSANAIVPLEDDSFLVSLGHQDAVVKISGTTVDWILANDDGWAPTFQSLLLVPPLGEDWTWFSHQHAPALDADGNLWLFDNGNWDRGTPYDPVADPEAVTDYSRVVAYDIDEVAGTVSENFSFVGDGDSTSPLYAELLGNADPLPVTGNVLGTWGAMMSEKGEDNEAAGLGARTMRILEVDPDGSVVFDLRLSGSFDESMTGWQGDRAIRVPSLYPNDVIVTVLE